MKKVMVLAAMGEAVTGVALIVVPSLVGWLLFGEELAGVAMSVARVTGIALVALGIACWPGSSALAGMLTYSALATLCLAWLGVGGERVGSLLWPAVVIHLALTILLVSVWFRERKKPAVATQRRRG